MELVGMEVRKTFLGFGTFSGIVESYDATAGYFKIQYEDGDSEEVDFEEITSILKDMGESPPVEHARRSNRGRRPKKRRRMEPSRTEKGDSGGDLENDRVNETLVKGSETLVKGIEGLIENGGFDEGFIKENGSFRVSGETQVNGNCFYGHSEDNAPLEDLKETQLEEFGTVNCNGDVEKKGEEGQRKRRRLPGREKFTPEVPLRRSARRASTALLSPPDSVPIENVLVTQDAELGGKQSFLVPKDSTKPALPPSSSDLNIDGLNVFDLFSVYTCLRSFSRMLFLSPFRLEAFVAALRCKNANFLIDSIHFSILQALMLHLKFLAEEGSQSATDCLRNLNWGLLDLITWPVFLIEYLLIRGSGMKSDFKLTHLKLMDVEYYKQPAGVKLEILRCLCDDVIEVEAIRSELNRRMMDSEHNVDANYNMNIEKKRKNSAIFDPESSSAQEVFEETDDGNSDECCLCGMDGSLICCDGCPAAFHSRCVGVAKDLLPDGDWYCPECVMEKGDGLVKLSKPFRGAEILGIDPHGRLYFGSCGRLLVSDSCESDASYHYYNKNDSDAVINVLKSSYASYSAIVNAISVYWGIPIDASSFNGQYVNGIHNIHEDMDAQMHSDSPLPSKQDVVSDGTAERVAMENSTSPEQCGPNSSEVSHLVRLNPVTSHQLVGMNRPFACSEPFDETVHVATCVQMSQQTGTDCSTGSIAPKVVISLKHTEVAVGSEKCVGFPGWGCPSLVTDRRKGGASQLQSDPGSYVNYYSFGRIALSIAEELMHKSSENNNNESKKSVEDIKSAQLKAISKKALKNCWYTYQKLSTDAQKENCGWCFSCRTSSDSDCLFKVADDKNLEGSKNRTVGLRSEKNKKSHIASAMHYILSIEDRVHGLLSGPWEKPHYSQHWRKAVLKASDVASLKPLLLTLELNLRRVALSVEWSKQVEYPHAVGSASIVLTSPVRASSNYGGNRKQAKKIISGDELSLISHSATTSGIYWWRGGRLSRQVFHWKLLPRSLAFKGGRQAGCRKIPNILYPDGSEFAKRSKYIAWRAAVEMSQSVAQFIYQVKDFDSNIKWTELSDTRLFPQLAKESKKIARPLKKVTIRRKCIEGTLVKYLLDFGKREIVPSIVTRHGVLLEECSSGRKSYWLNETHVPLNILKSFEEKKIARLLKKTDSGILPEKGSKCNIKKRKRSKGLSYLISRVQESEKQLCGHCNKDVLIREAVNCQFCDGFFHRKHFRVPKGAITTTYTCCRCKDKRSVKVKTQEHKAVSKRRKFLKGKKSQNIPKKGKHILVKSKKKFNRHERGNQGKSKRGKPKKSENGLRWQKRKRSVVHHSYWLNGLLWTRKPVNEQRRYFRESKVLLPLQHTEDPSMKPLCCLCREDYNSGLIYICCENCEDWFHGDAFCLTLETINNLIGFKCHKCLMRSKPVCPFSKNALVSDGQLDRECNVGVDIVGVEHQNNEDQLHGSSYEDCSAIFHSEDHQDEEQSGNVFIDPEEEPVLYPKSLLTNGHIVGVKHEHDEDRLHGGAYEDCSAVVHSEDHLKGEQREIVLIHSEEEPVLYPKTVSTNGPIVQSLEHVEANVTSVENEFQVGVASHRIEEGLYRMMEVPDSLVIGTQDDSTVSHPQTIIPAVNLNDVEGGNS